MLRVNFSAYRTYVTDSLYQWDKNQKLVISGMDLVVAPEIRFTNEIFGKSIVRQSRLEDGVIIATIPNSLLQYHYKIRAYVGIYVDDAFKTLEIIDIPVIAQERPLDYVLSVDDDEVYSFNELDNKVEASLAKYEKADVALQESVKNYRLARQEFIEGIKEANKSFKLSRVYTSIDAMNAGYDTDDVPLYGFVLINTGNASDIDNAKLFVKTETQYDYVAYLIGMQGEKGDAFTYEDFTYEQLELLRGPQGIQGPPGETPTLQDWLGTEQIGSPTKPLYYDGEKFVEFEGFVRPTSLEASSWDFIASVAEAGRASDYFRIGEEKKVLLKNGIEVSVAIMGFNDTPLASGTGKAGITFILVDLYETTTYNDNKRGGVSELPSEVSMYIKTVKRPVGESSSSSVGVFPIRYTDLSNSYFLAGGSPVKYLLGADGTRVATEWWIWDEYITGNGTVNGRYVQKNGSAVATTTLSTKYGRCFGFCI